MLTQLLEKLKHPGLLGLIGTRQEKRCREQLHSYFESLGQRIVGMNLEQLTDLSQHANAVELARHSVQAKLAYTIRTFSPLLKGILEINIHDALMGTQQDSPLSGGG